MSDPLPIDVGDLDSPFPDLGHEAIRQVVIEALGQFWVQHLALMDRTATAEQAVTDLQARVAALEQPPAPEPTPTPAPPAVDPYGAAGP